MLQHYAFTRAFAVAVLSAVLGMGCGDTPESLVASSKRYLAKSENEPAIIQLRNALQKDPDIPEARFLLGKALLDTGDVLGAEKELREARELGHRLDEVVPPLARALVLMGQYKSVVDELSGVEVKAPTAHAELMAAVGQAHLAMGDTAAARASFAKSLAAEPKYVPAHLGQARVTANEGHLAKASSMVDAALSISGNDADAWQLKGDLLLAEKQSESALAAYRKAVEVKPGFLAGHTAIVSLLLRQDKVPDAAKQVDAMKRAAPNHPQTLYFQALLAYRENKIPAARTAIQQQLKRAPDNLPGLLLGAAIEMELKSYAQAEAYLGKVFQRAPQDRTARRIMITGYMNKREGEKALEALKPMLEHIEKDASMLALAGEVFMLNGEAARAASYFAKAAAHDPENAATRTSLALSQLAQGQTDKALRVLEETAVRDSGIRADLALIATLMRRTEYEKALGAIDVLEKKLPASPVPHNLRGVVLLHKRNISDARRSFERALEKEPTYHLAAANLAKLDLADKKPDAARARFERMLAKDPNHMQALLALATLRAQVVAAADKPAAVGQPQNPQPDQETVALVRKAIAAHPAEATPRLALINYYLATDPTKAIEAAQQALAAIPNRPEILEGAARAYRAAGHAQQALPIYKKLASMQAASPRPHLAMAEVHLAGKNYDDAIDSLRKALALQPDLIDAQRGMVKVHLDAGRPREALSVAREIQKQRKDETGYLLEGDIQAAGKNWNEAAEAYRAGLARANSSLLAARLHAVLEAGSSDAGRMAAAWLKDHPKDAGFRLYLAQAALAKKDYQGAARYYRQVLDLEPTNVVVLNNLAWVGRQLKDPEALAHAEKANALAPDQPDIMDTLATLLMDKGETARGLELLRKASAAAPHAATIRLNLAKGLMKAGQKDAARRELDELAKLGDKFSAQGEVKQLRSAL